MKDNKVYAKIPDEVVRLMEGKEVNNEGWYLRFNKKQGYKGKVKVNKGERRKWYV